MKKILLLLALLIFIPFKLKASTITAKLTGPKEITIGETLTIKYTINVPDVGVNGENLKGIVGIAYKIDYNQDILSLKSVKTDNYETTFIKGEQTMKINSLPKIKDCLEESIYCGSGTYIATITFDILAKDSTIANIKITDPIIGVIDTESMLEDMLNGLSYEEIIANAIKESPNNFESLIFTINKPKEIDTRANNTYLSKLEIQNYPIEFNKDTREYEITVGKNINRIVIKAETEDEKSYIKITGDDDLEANNNKVLIEVTAENKDKATYTINVIHKEEDDEIITEIEEEKPEIEITADKKILKLFGIIGIVLILLIILFTIKSIIKKKKLNNMFNDL